MGIRDILKEALPKSFDVIFNGINLSEYFYVKSVKGRGLVGKEVNMLTLPGMDGAHFAGSRYLSRPIVVEVLVLADNDEELRRLLEKINGLLVSSGPEPLKFSDEPDRTYYAIAEGVSEVYEQEGWHSTSIVFVCPESTKGGNHQIDTFTTEKAIYNQGTAPALPIFNVHFTATSTNFQFTNNGQTFRLIREFAAGDRVVIDCKRGLVQLNGLDAMPIRDWRTPFKRLTLEPGENQLTADPAADVEVTFTERYL